jgi:hypothetical protein
LRVDESARAVAQLAGDGCTILPGAIALDEATGELVGVGGARPRSGCDAAKVALLQVDAFRETIADALTAAADAGKPRPGKAVRPTLDLGDPCEAAADCAAGVCVFEGVARYCSRLCGTGDRCPNGMRCVRAAEGRMACVESG